MIHTLRHSNKTTICRTETYHPYQAYHTILVVNRGDVPSLSTTNQVYLYCTKMAPVQVVKPVLWILGVHWSIDIVHFNIAGTHPWYKLFWPPNLFYSLFLIFIVLMPCFLANMVTALIQIPTHPIESVFKFVIHSITCIKTIEKTICALIIEM